MMTRIDVWTIVGGGVAAFIVSWMLDAEVLFLLAGVIVAALAAVLGVVLGCLMLVERMSPETAENPGWRDADTATQRSIAR